MARRYDSLSERILLRIEQETRTREGEVARGEHQDLYKLGKQQGILLGLDLARDILLNVLNEEDE